METPVAAKPIIVVKSVGTVNFSPSDRQRLDRSTQATEELAKQMAGVNHRSDRAVQNVAGGRPVHRHRRRIGQVGAQLGEERRDLALDGAAVAIELRLHALPHLLRLLPAPEREEADDVRSQLLPDLFDLFDLGGHR